MAKIDNDTFRTLNGNVVLYAGRINHWAIVVKRPDLAAKLLAEGETLAVLDLADDIVQDWWRQVIGPQAVSDMRATGVFEAKGLPSGKRIQRVQPWPITFGNEYVYIAFEFEPKGKLELTWPWQIGLLGNWDKPQSGLIATYATHQVIDVPGVGDAIEQTWDDVKDDAASAGNTLKSVAMWFGVGALALWAMMRGGK